MYDIMMSEQYNTGRKVGQSGYIGKIVKHFPGLIGSPKIVPFIGFAGNDKAYVEGLIVAENGISRPEEGQSKWKNITSMMKRYASNELEDVRVEVTFRGLRQVVKTDKYGIYRCIFDLEPCRLDDGIWQKAAVRLPDFHGSPEARGDVMSISNNPQFGIISDIDDTILVSYATQKLMKLRLMLLNNAHTRMPFEGVAAFYEALQHGSGGGYNPIFYVSNSEWNLYDLLYEFIEFNRIPKGPLLLREMAIRVLRPWKLREVNRNHKTEVITRLFNLYPDMKFILIGDSGQRDPEIYTGIVRLFPERVAAIYIRDIGIADKLARVKVLSQLVRQEYSTDLLLVRDTEAAAEHALEKGFIRSEFINSILQEKEKDKQQKELTLKI